MFGSMTGCLIFHPLSSFLPSSLPGDPLEQLVRHFLIETGPRGVKIKGCQNESYFGQLCGKYDCHNTSHRFNSVQDTETDCFNLYSGKGLIYLFASTLDSFCLYEKSSIHIISHACFLFLSLSQEVCLLWCTSIQLRPSLCHVLFASQTKVKSVSLQLYVVIFISKLKICLVTLSHCYWIFNHSDNCLTADCDLLDLVGELQEMQSPTNTSTAADLLKQGAGRTWAYSFYSFLNFQSGPITCSVTIKVGQQRLLKPHNFPALHHNDIC